MKQIRIVTACRKGGTGKSTVAVGLASVFEKQEIRTLVVDLDPQGNATKGLGGDVGGPSTAELLCGEHPTPQEIRTHLHLLAGNSRLLENEVAEVHPDDLRFLSKKTEYEVIIYDTPPSSIVLERFATSAATHCLIAVVAHSWAVSGGIALLESLMVGRERERPGPENIAWVVNALDSRRTDDKAMAEGLAGINTEVPVFTVRVDTKLKTATGEGALIMDAARTSKSALDLLAIKDWLLQ